jgi:hypothetical protein
MSFEKLKQNRTAAISKLVNAAEKAGGTKTYGDDRLWSPTVDKTGNGYAIIRFLPAKEGEDLPWVRYWDHGFKGPSGRWYIENSLTSIGQTDPVSELNSVLWNSGNEKDKEVARDRKRRLHYVSNILVISDPANPANEGKVFIYKYGKKIFDKINDLMQPQFQDETPVNPFDFWGGANFRLKIRNFEGYRNYDKSEFDKPTELFDGNDARLEEIYGQLHSLSDFVDPKNYKSYTELKKKLIDVLGEEVVNGSASVAYTPVAEVNVGRSAEAQSAPAASSSYDDANDDIPFTSDSGSTDGDDDDISYFARLARG